MKISLFDFNLPSELIANFPEKRRDASRLLVLKEQGEIEHRLFRDITEYLSPGDMLVLNDTKVIPARLRGKKQTGGKIEILLVSALGNGRFSILSRGRYTGMVSFGGGLRARIKDGSVAEFECKDIGSYLWEHGLMPLPPYIKREPLPEDRNWYQTVYARKEGSIAAPTAGLHFTEGLLKELKQRGIKIRYITLHVGLGTFMPVKTETVEAHRMQPESFEVDTSLIEEIEEIKKSQGRVVAVGTTVTRTLEALFSGKYHSRGTNGTLQGSTDLFIYPGYQFRAVDVLLTNFHLPRSTPLLLVSAFAGRKNILKAYDEAIKRRYRFFSYGDAMLILGKGE